jgi:hypothetical protein
MKEETIEEAAEMYSLEEAEKFALSKFTKKDNPKEGRVNWDSILEVLKVGVLTGHTFGAKWQQERMYSEDDMKQFGLYLGDNLKKLKGKSIDEIFEQFKKK